MKKNKKKKVRAVFLLLCLVVLAVFGGIKGGEYLAYRLSKPIDQNNNTLSGIKSGSSAGKQQSIAETDAVGITSSVMEFIEAEHTKKTEKLTNMVAPDYYNTFAKNLKSLSTASALVQDINFVEVSNKRINVEVSYIKKSKTRSETITMELFDNSWKVTDVKW